MAMAPKHGAAPFLKICFILEPLHAGVGRHVVDVARILADRGHDIHVLYSPIRLEPQFATDIGRHPRIRCRTILMKPGPCLGDVAAFRQVRAYVKANGPFDIIHGQSSKGGVYARLLKLFGARRVLYSPHAFVTRSPLLPRAQRIFYGAIEYVLSQLTDTVVCASRDERDHAVTLGIAPKKLAVVANGREPPPRRDRQTVRAGLGLAPEQVVIGYAGRLHGQKAPERLIEACLRVLPQSPHLHLLVVGDGPQRGALQATLDAAGLGGRATWLGEVEATQYMPAMDFLVMPSLYEGFAYVLIEAVQAGLPVVSTPVGGTHESVAPGENGFIVPHGDIGRMADAIYRLGHDAELRRAMAEASLARASRFTVARMADGIEALYYRQLSDVGAHFAREAPAV